MSDTAVLDKRALSEKSARHGTEGALSKLSVSEHSHIYLVVVVAVGVFICEIVSMTIFHLLHLSVWFFILSSLAAFGIALLAVSYKSIKAAAANPVDSLRYE